MKKIIFVFVFIMTMVSGSNAQDGFFRSDYSLDRGNPGVDEPVVPQGGYGLIHDMDASVPLGSGLLVMTALGCVYLMRKKVNS